VFDEFAKVSVVPAQIDLSGHHVHVQTVLPWALLLE
jgi:hypothetical protein